jgi:hypothetical protein
VPRSAAIHVSEEDLIRLRELTEAIANRRPAVLTKAQIRVAAFELT